MRARFLAMFLAIITSTIVLNAQTSGWIDISAPIDPKTTPLYPGDAGIKLTFLHNMKSGDGFTLSELEMGAHTSTHVDAPMHFIKDGASLDQAASAGCRRNRFARRSGAGSADAQAAGFIRTALGSFGGNGR